MIVTKKVNKDTDSGYFRGINFSWMLGFVAIRGKNFEVDGSSLNHTPHARVEQWPLVSKWKLWYELPPV